MMSQNSKTQLSSGMEYIRVYRFVPFDDASQAKHVELNNNQQHFRVCWMQIGATPWSGFFLLQQPKITGYEDRTHILVPQCRLYSFRNRTLSVETPMTTPNRASRVS